MTDDATSFGCKTCDADPTHLLEAPPTLFCTEHKPDGAAELCESCRPRATDRNHPPGMIFVGWGRGWQACTRCGGSGLERTRHCDDAHCELPHGHHGVHRMGLYIRARSAESPRVLVHADGGACDGTPLVNGRCPKCGIAPDMQSTALR